MNSQRPPSAPGNPVLLLLCMAQFLLIMDISIVNVALPSIQRDLAIRVENLQLVVTMYAITFGGLLLLGGRLADIRGRRQILITGIVLFTLASLLCGAAPSEGVLIAARALQGIGGALVSPAALSLLTTLFSEEPARNRALGVWSMVAAIGGAAGLLLGGVLTDLAGWRTVFYLNLPIGTAVALAAAHWLPETKPGQGRVDIPGALLVTGSFITLVLGLGRGERYGFTESGTLLVLVAAILLLAAFVLVESRVQEPLIDFRLFQMRTLTGANLATMMLSAVIVSGNYFLTLYFQQVLKYSPLQTALAFIPQTIVSAITSLLAARWLRSLQSRVMFSAGMTALLVGAGLLSQLPASGTYLRDVLPGLLCLSAGLGIGFTVGTSAATSGVAPSQQGAASGIFNMSQQVGGAAGLAILATVAASARDTSGLPEAAALARGFGSGFLAAAGLSLVGVVFIVWLVRDHEKTGSPARERQPPVSTAHTACCQPGIVQHLMTELEAPGSQKD